MWKSIWTCFPGILPRARTLAYENSESQVVTTYVGAITYKLPINEACYAQPRASGSQNERSGHLRVFETIFKTPNALVKDMAC